MNVDRLHSIFWDMKKRCYGSYRKQFQDYGGRGIVVCDEWKDTSRVIINKHYVTKGWLNFKKWALSNGYDDNLTIDRIDVNKNYCPENCRWITTKEKNNNKRSNKVFTYKDKTQTLAQWCEELNLPYHSIKHRLSIYGFSFEEAIKAKDYRAHYITYKGKEKSIKEWCLELNLDYKVISARLNRGWDIEKAFELPVNKILK